MAEIEDVTLGRAALLQHVPCPLLDDRPRCQQDRRIQVALERFPRCDPVHGFVQRHPPVHPDDVRTGLAQEPEQFASADAEVEAGNAGCRHRGEDLPLSEERSAVSSSWDPGP
jgi:hypothetical protein